MEELIEQKERYHSSSKTLSVHKVH